MKDKFQNRYRVDSTRLKGYDYSKTGLYFVTICTQGKWPYFGKLVNQQLDPTPIGTIATEFWHNIPAHFCFVELDAFVLMPDHLHGILYFQDSPASLREYCNLSPEEQLLDSQGLPTLPGSGNRFGPQSNNLASVIRNYKGAVTSYAQKNGIRFRWQPRYHDRIIRTPEELKNVRHYIRLNPV